ARLRSTPVKRSGSGRGAGTASEFSSHLSTEATPAALTTSAPLAANPLLAVQEIADATAGRSRAKARADAMLDRLEDIRIGLLTGFVPKERLVELSRLARARRREIDDPRLAELLG